MDEQVMIDLLEANKKLPAQEEILARFKEDFVDRVQAALKSPQDADALPVQRKAPEAVTLKAAAQEAAAGDSWSFAEDTNAGDLPQVAEPVAEQQEPALQDESSGYDQPAETNEADQFQADQDSMQEPVPEEPLADQPALDEFEQQAQAALEAVAPESPTAELSAHPSPDLDSGDYERLEAQQEAVGMATEALLVQDSPAAAVSEFAQAAAPEDDMMQVPEELTRPEGPEGEQTSDGGKKKKKR